MQKSLDGNEIRQIRKNLGVNQITFAGILGISSPYLSAVERGIKTPSQQLTNLIMEKAQGGANAAQAPSTTQDLLFKALMDRIDAQGKALQGLQDLIVKLDHSYNGLGLEIGKIRDKMDDAAKHNDVKLLGLAGGRGK